MADKLRNMDTEIFWQAVKTNDVRFDGAFVLGVKTTGIYCKPSCRHGFRSGRMLPFMNRAARRSRTVSERVCGADPKWRTRTDPQVKAVLRACRLIDEHEQFRLTI